MKRGYKITLLVTALILVLSGCTPSGNTAEKKSDITLKQVNEFLNTSAGLGPNTKGNVIAIIPHAHIDGPKNETPFYAFVDFKYRARDYIKYQVSYLSCTCRETSVNIWQTMYIELSLPESKNPDDVKIKYISFDQDSTGKYTGGFWGDSNPIPSGQTYELFKNEYISFFPNKEAKYLRELKTIDDIKAEDYTAGEGRENFAVDTFSGASVSANNIIRIIHSIIDYHATDEFFVEK